MAVSALAVKVYTSYKSAPKEFLHISNEVNVLHMIVRKVEAQLNGLITLDTSLQIELQIMAPSCKGVLEELDDLMMKYESLGSPQARVWDRLEWGKEDITALRTKIISTTILLHFFYSTLPKYA